MLVCSSLGGVEWSGVGVGVGLGVGLVSKQVSKQASKQASNEWSKARREEMKRHYITSMAITYIYRTNIVKISNEPHNFTHNNDVTWTATTKARGAGKGKKNLVLHIRIATVNERCSPTLRSPMFQPD